MNTYIENNNKYLWFNSIKCLITLQFSQTSKNETESDLFFIVNNL